MRYSTKIIAGEHRVEKNTKKKEKYCRKTIENAEKLCYNKKADNKQFIHTNLASCIPKLQEAAL